MPITINGTGPVDGITSINTSVSSTELGYLDGVTSGIQSQINTSGGLVKIVDNTFSASSAVNINNCFSSTYETYRIMVDFTAFSTSLNVQMRLRVSGSDNTTLNYTRQVMYASSTTLTGLQNVNQNNWEVMVSGSTYADLCKFSMDMYAPNLARKTATTVAYSSVDASGNLYTLVGNALFNATTQFDGFSLFPSTGNISGTVRVYGYRN